MKELILEPIFKPCFSFIYQQAYHLLILSQIWNEVHYIVRGKVSSYWVHQIGWDITQKEFNLSLILKAFIIFIQSFKEVKMQNADSTQFNLETLSIARCEQVQSRTGVEMQGQVAVVAVKKVVRCPQLKLKKKRFNKSLWTLQENMKYIEFLEQNRQLFQSTKQNRRHLKINKMLSLYIKSRSPDQCRSHHQKMAKYHSTIEGIISHVHLLKNMQNQDAEDIERERKSLLRIRKKVKRVEVQVAIIEEDMEKDLWDVLNIHQINQPFLQKGQQYL